MLLVAGAGSGKTTEAARFLNDRPGRTAWLTVDQSDRSPSRFVSYLAAAIGKTEPSLEAMVEELLADGMLAEDCAAVLAERLGPGWTVVIDDLHNLEPEAPALVPLRTFLRGLPPDALAVLVSRLMPSLHLSNESLRGNLSGVFDAELAFDLAETRALLGMRHASSDAEAVWSATGGWAAGIVFDELRRPDGHSGLPPAEDPLFYYLSGEIIERLPHRIRRALLRSAVLDIVTGRRLAALPQEDPPVMLDELTRLHLPANAEAGTLRYHPQFREFLEHCLARELPTEVPSLLETYGQLLADEGFREEAVDVFLQIGRTDRAVELADGVMTDLRRRGDWAKILHWTEAFGEGTVRRRPALREAQVRALLNSRRQTELEDLVHGMLADGEVGELVDTAPDVAAWAVWALHGSGEWAKLVPLLPPRGRSRIGEVMRYMLVSTVARDPPEDLSESALGRMHPLHVVLQEALYFQGRLDAASALAGVAAARGGPVTAAVAQVHKVNVLRARGEIAAARRVLESVPSSIRSSRFIEFWLHAESELCLEEGNGTRALQLIRDARAASARHGWRVGDGAIFGAVEGKLLVRLGAYADAIGVLTEVRDWCAQRGLASFREWTEAWLGGAMLLLDRPADQAREVLWPAVQGMRRARRHLELPAAALFLAEAEWRLGDEDAHDDAAEVAFAAAEQCGTLVPLATVLELVPGVLARKLDAEAAGSERRWSALVRLASATAAAPDAEGARLRVRTLGTPRLELDGVPLPQVPMKAVELAAEVARAGPPGIPREQLSERLFSGSRNGPNYLRQLVFRLRRVLPADLELRSTGRRLAWKPAEVVISDDVLLESLYQRARTEAGPGRTATLKSALELAEMGTYLEGLDDESVVERRHALMAVAMGVRMEYARAMRAAGRPGEAVGALRAALGADPYREEAWQELMRDYATFQGPASVARIFLDCRQSLREVGLEPSRETVELLERLRG